MLVPEAAGGSDRLRLGHVLGNYRLIRVIGEGGVGTVYEGEHIRLGRKMALKVLHPDIASGEVIARFFNEARAVNQIRHPNIIDVEDFVTADTGEHYLIMELLVGEDLRSVLSREGVLAPERVTMIGEQIAGALSAVHRADILHRDLKPDNIFLVRRNGQEVAKLLDFGIAKFTTDREGMTREGMTLGTPEYMAPEQILSNGKPGPTADIYSLGMLLYECLAGAPAFTATTTAAILRGHISEHAPPPSARRGEPVPPVLEAAVLKCLQKDPALRFQNAGELIAALRSDRAVEVVRPKLRSGTEPIEETRPRSRTLQMIPAFLMAAAALVLHIAPRAETEGAQAAPPLAQRAPAPAPAPPPAEAPAAPSATAAAKADTADTREAPAPTAIEVSLTSTPDGADLFLGSEPLGTAPVKTSIAVSEKPVLLVARFADGTEVKQTIVPDRPLPAIAFVKPTPMVATKKPHPPRPARPAATSAAKQSPTPDDRDATINPFK